MLYTEDIFEKYPQLDSIAEAIEVACEEAKKKHTQGETVSSDYKNDCYYFQITKILSRQGASGRWQPSLRPKIQGGEEEFNKELEKVLASNPYGIEITVTDPAGKKIFKEIQIKTNTEEIKQIQTEKKNKEVFERQAESLELIKLEMEFEREKDQLLRTIDRQADEIEDLSETIKQLEELLDEKNKTLSGVSEQYKVLEEKKTNPPIVSILGAVLQQGIGGLLVKYPAIIDSLNLGEAKREELMKQLTADINGKSLPEKTATTEASFKEASNNDLEGKSEEFKKAYSELVVFLKMLSDEEINTVYLIMSLCIKDAKLDVEKAKRMIKAMQEVDAERANASNIEKKEE